MIVIGLTGGIASGKSTAAGYLGERGARVIDADRLGHLAYEPGGPAFAGVVAAFGEEVVAADGTIDRRALGARVFGRPEELARLTDVVWPAIRSLASEEIAAAPAEAVVVLEAAVLLEAGWEDLVDEVWLVRVERETAVARAVARGGLDADEVAARIDAQLSNEERAARADVVIDNSGDEVALRAALDREWARVSAAAARGAA